MEYTVQALAQMVGVSPRTLRYYHQIGLLAPARVTQAGYRIYGREQVDALQGILLYREMGVPLGQIAALMEGEGPGRLEGLRRHQERLLGERARIDRLIETVQRSIAAEERGIPMKDHEKFEGFKRELVQENEAAYGQEARKRYGDQAVDAAGDKLLGLSREEYQAMEEAGQAAKEAVEAHRRWLGYTWSDYTPEAHIGLGELYAADPRFSQYYDRGVPGRAAFFRDCIRRWAGR